MLSLISQVLYLTVIPAGLVLGSTAERLAVLGVAAVLLLRLAVRRRSAARFRRLRAAEVVALAGTEVRELVGGQLEVDGRDRVVEVCPLGDPHDR